MATGVTVRAFVASRFALDGGAMHGIVPRTLWERFHTPDAQNRIALVSRLLLVDHEKAGARILIELGMGQRFSAKERAIYALEEGPSVPDLLRNHGVDPETVTHVVLTHGHFDHAGGIGFGDDPAAEVCFPKAEHVLSADALAHARTPAGKEGASFRGGDFALLERARVRVWSEGGPVAPGIEGRLSNGHTEGLLVPLIPERDDGEALAMPSDLIPTRSHLKPNWVAAYDERPSLSIAEKRALIDELGRRGGAIALYHDPLVATARAVPGKDGGFELAADQSTRSS